MPEDNGLLYLEKLRYTHHIVVESRKGSNSSKTFGVCLERSGISESLFWRRIKRKAAGLPQSLSVIEPVTYKTHRIRFLRVSERSRSRTFVVSLPGYDSKDIARELYKYCMGGKIPRW
jgi:hypothetical protein